MLDALKLWFNPGSNKYEVFTNAGEKIPYVMVKSVSDNAQDDLNDPTAIISVTVQIVNQKPNA